MKTAARRNHEVPRLRLDRRGRVPAREGRLRDGSDRTPARSWRTALKRFLTFAAANGPGVGASGIRHDARRSHGADHRRGRRDHRADDDPDHDSRRRRRPPHRRPRLRPSTISARSTAATSFRRPMSATPTDTATPPGHEAEDHCDDQTRDAEAVEAGRQRGRYGRAVRSADSRRARGLLAGLYPLTRSAAPRGRARSPIVQETVVALSAPDGRSDRRDNHAGPRRSHRSAQRGSGVGEICSSTRRLATHPSPKPRRPPLVRRRNLPDGSVPIPRPS